MLLLSGLATLTALLLAGWAIAGILERFVIEGLDRRLDGEIALLASTVGPDGRVNVDVLRRREGALDTDAGWQWQIVGPHGMLGSQHFPMLSPHPHPKPPLPDTRSPPPLAPAPPVLPEAGPIVALDGSKPEDGSVHARRFVITTHDGPVTITAAAPRSVIERPIRGAIAPLLIALALLAGLLSVATIVQLRLGLRPLRRLRDDVAAIRLGAVERVSEDQPAELQPLAAELNALAADNREALATARLSAANLAHALKTPVATLAIDVRDDPVRAGQVSRIESIIRHHLARARTSAANRRSSTMLGPAIEDVMNTVCRLHADRNIGFDCSADAGLAVALDLNDFMELVGNLIDNAARHAHRAVKIGARVDPSNPRNALIRIEDDGPGILPELRNVALGKGVRLDEHGEGFGFGLFISAQITQLYGGRLELKSSDLGGLLVLLNLPRDQ